MIKILFAGSPAAAATTLKLLTESQSAAQGVYKICGVLTNPPSAKGRKKELVPTDAGLFALQNGIPVFAPQKLDAAAREEIAASGFDLLLSFAYGHIFGPKFLSLFKMGGINVHPSLLPKYRGATPVPAAILNMDSQTAVTVQTLALGMDEGDILAQKKIELDFTETTDSLLDTSSKIAAELLEELLQKTASLGALPKGIPQQGDASYTKIIMRDDALINWKQSAQKICAHIRAYTSEPGAFTRIGSESGDTLKILKAAPLSAPVRETAAVLNAAPGTVIAFSKKDGILIQCADGILCVTELQRQMRKAMNYKDFMNGERGFVGTLLC